jgi:hypothetical protein
MRRHRSAKDGPSFLGELRGRDVVAGRQLLIGILLDGDPESLGQHVESGGLGEAATHGKSLPRETQAAQPCQNEDQNSSREPRCRS